MSLETKGVSQLELEAVIGFNGHVMSGLKVHPDREHLIYPLGSTVILKTIRDDKQDFLQGHTDNVSCISVSRSGTYIASGQVNAKHFQAPIIIWDFTQRAECDRLLLHKTKVEALSFSPNDKYLVSVGGQDDNRVFSIVVWNLETKQGICGSPVSALMEGHSLTVQFSNTSDNVFVSAGSGTLQVWKLDLPNKRIQPTECQTGKLKRVVKCVEISEDDQFIFCGTTSGDIMKINMETGLLDDCGPIKRKYCQGVTVLRALKSGDLLVGSGSGTFTLCSRNKFKIHKEVQLDKGVTSIALRGEGQQFFVGTEAGEIHRFSYDDFNPERISTSHSSAVNDVVICHGKSELFVTCSLEDIRVWYTKKSKELLRITVPNMICHSVDVMTDGRCIIGAWSDGNIRVFDPENGELMIIIHNAHRMGATVVVGTRDCKRLVSGGGDGQVCVWELQPHGHKLLGTMKQHKAAITCIKIKSNDKECATASADGSCIIWDIEQFVSLKNVTAKTLFSSLCYHPEEYQIIISGTDRKIVYWDVFDGSVIIKLEGSQSGGINGVHISQDGRHFVTGGDDKMVKVWEYLGGRLTHVGKAHGSSITNVKLCCNNSTLISTSSDGAILLWRFPHPPSSS